MTGRHVVRLVEAELRSVRRLVAGAVEETDLLEQRLQLVLQAADDLHKGWTHLRI